MALGPTAILIEPLRRFARHLGCEMHILTTIGINIMNTTRALGMEDDSRLLSIWTGNALWELQIVIAAFSCQYAEGGYDEGIRET